MKNLLPCFKCGKELDSAAPAKNQPSKGTAFWTTGHWGSTFFDSIDGSNVLEISICDPCLREHVDRTWKHKYGE